MENEYNDTNEITYTTVDDTISNNIICFNLCYYCDFYF